MSSGPVALSLEIPHTDSREIDWIGCFDFSFLFLTSEIFITRGVKILILIYVIIIFSYLLIVFLLFCYFFLLLLLLLFFLIFLYPR